MNQGIKGIGLFFTGWILALTTNYLGALDTGIWVPFAVTGVEIFGLILMLIGVRQSADQYKNYKTAGIVATFALIASLGMGAIQALSLEGITEWMAIAAICLAVTGDISFMILTGLVLLGLSDRIRHNGNEVEANRLDYLWATFLTFAILYLVIQAVAVLLVNEGLPALTYIVPATGLPLLIVGTVLITRVYQSYPLQVQEDQEEGTH
jgi:hypothetical protein